MPGLLRRPIVLAAFAAAAVTLPGGCGNRGTYPVTGTVVPGIASFNPGSAWAVVEP